MTHVEFLEKLIANYEKNFEAEPSNDKEVIAFRKGIIFAWKLAIVKLKNGDEKNEI